MTASRWGWHRTAPVLRYLLLAAVLLATGCEQKAAPVPVTPEPGGSLAIAILEPFDFFTPVRAVRPASEEFMVHVTPPLGRVTEQGDIQWLMARAPSALQPGLLFRLRPAFWEDGVRLTAADFALTVHVMLHPGAPGHERSRFGLVRDVVALDDSTLYFDLLEFSRERFRDALIAPLPAHVLGPDPDPRHLYEWPVSRKPLSCGPFRVVESSTDTLVLERREDSGWPPPRLDRVIVRSVEPGIAVQQFRDGAVDVVDALPAAQAEALRGVRGARLLAFVGASYLYVGWNLRDARFGDLTVRRAAAMAVDVERLCRDLTLGQGDVARGPLVPVLGLPDTSSVLPHDLKQARALLDAAGWQDHDRDGIRDRGGARLACNLLVPENDPLREQSAAAVARALRDLEIEVSVRVLVVEEFYARLQRGAFEAYLGQWFPRRGQPLEDVWHSEATDRFNYGGFNDPGVDSLLVRLRLEQPGPSEEELLAALQRRVYAEQPYLFLFQEPRFTVFAARVQGVRPTVLSTFWNLPEWWVPRAQRSPEP